MVKATRLSPADWIDAALGALAEGGLAAVAIEPLAARLGTTKGSFYWHFAGRNALIEATLARWVQMSTDRPIADLRDVDDPMERLDRLYDRVLDRPDIAAVDSALLADAGHPLVAPVLATVSERRLAFLATAFSDLGRTPAAARAEALVAYSAYLGIGQLLRHSADLVNRDRVGFRRVMRRNLQAQR